MLYKKRRLCWLAKKVIIFIKYWACLPILIYKTSRYRSYSKILPAFCFRLISDPAVFKRSHITAGFKKCGLYPVNRKAISDENLILYKSSDSESDSESGIESGSESGI